MKIVGLCASPRPKGNTRRLLDYFLEQCSKRGAETKVYSIVDHHVDYCMACEQCMREGKCPVKDDYTTLLPQIMEADALILATPNYAFDLSAQLKAVIDRSHAFLYYCQTLERKYGVGICVAGHPAMTKSIAKRLGQSVWLCGGYYVGALTGISKHRDKKGFVKEKEVYKRAEKMAAKIVRNISSRKRHWFQTWLREAFVVSRLKKLFFRREKEYPYVAEKLRRGGLENEKIAG